MPHSAEMAMDEIVGKTFDGFRVLEELGSGGEGIVFRAECVMPRFGLEVGTVVALKMMSGTDYDGRKWRRLNTRTQELTRLQHPNVVRYYGCFHVPQIGNDLQFVVQEFLHGETLKQRLERFRWGLEVEEGLKTISDVLDGLIYTTSNGIIHRDIKPSNIFVCEDGTVKLIDFEIAKRETTNGGTSTTTAFQGSLEYLAPEFLDSPFSGDVRSDIYSLGVVIHEALTKIRPFHSESQSLKSPITIHGRIKLLIGEFGAQVLQNTLAIPREERYGDFLQFKKAFKRIVPYVLHSRYQMMQLIGEGGYGEVFKAYDQKTGKYVAIKHLFDAAGEKKFLKEAHAMQKLNDEKFVRYVECFKGEGIGNSSLYLVMEFLDGMPGSSLSDVIRKVRNGTKYELRCVLEAFSRYATGLQKMHKEGLSHRDIKPANLYCPWKNPSNAVIMDLGIVHDAKGKTITQGLKGTPDYISPEVAQLKSKGEGPGDIFALGLCLYEVLSGKKAYAPLPQQIWLEPLRERFAKGEKPTFKLPYDLEFREDLLKLLRGMTELNPKKRLTAEQVVKSIDKMREKVGQTVVIDVLTDPEPVPVPEPVSVPTPVSEPTPISVSTPASEHESAPEPAPAPVLPEDEYIPNDDYSPWWRKGSVLWAGGGIAAVGVLLAVVVGWPIVRLKLANNELDKKVIPAYRNLPYYNGSDILVEESAWSAQYGPESDTLMSLPVKDFAECTNRLAKVKHELTIASSPKPTESEMGYADFFPDKEKGIVCIFKGTKYLSQTNVLMAAGEYNCAYQNLAETNGIFKFEKKAVYFTVKGKSHCKVQALGEWGKTTEYENWLKTNSIPPKVESPSAPQETPVISPPQLSPIQVLLPTNMPSYASCEVDGSIWTNNFSLTVRGRAYNCVYRRDGGKYLAQTNSFFVKAGMTTVSLPPVREWQLVPPDPKKKAEVIRKCEKLMDIEPFDARQNRLEQAESVLKSAVDDNLLTSEEAKKLEADINERKNWIVGRVDNRWQRAIEVDGQSIKPGSSKVFTFKDGLPQPWEARSEGCEPMGLRREFDGQTIVVSAMREIPKPAPDPSPPRPRLIEVKIPELPEGITCIIDEEEVSGSIRRNVGQTISYAYFKKGRDYVGPKSYVVKDTDSQSLPLPTEKDWRIKPVKMFVPMFSNDISCRIDGVEVPSGGEVVKVPGKQMVCVYLREGFYDVVITNTVPSANFTEIPGPSRWRLLPVSVMLPTLPQNVTCMLDGKIVRDSIKCYPGQEIVLTFRQAGFADLKVRYSVTRDARQIIPAPERWEKLTVRVKVKIPELPDGATCFVEGLQVRDSMLKQPRERVKCTYRRKGYRDIKITYEVTEDVEQTLPKPKTTDWEYEAVQVWIPRLTSSITCLIDGSEVSGGGTVTAMPGRKITCTYRRKGYYDVQKEYSVIPADVQELPSPIPSDWVLLPVNVKVPELPSGVTCWIDGKEVTDSISRKPGTRIDVVYKRRGYEDVKQPVLVSMEDNQVLPEPTDWTPRAVKIRVPDLEDGVTCLVNGQRVLGTLSKRPHEQVKCTYRRKGYKDIQITYNVTDEPEQTLSKPKPSEWEYEAIQVWIPRLTSDITCWIDGREVSGGDSVTNLPGSTMVCTYKRKGYKDVQKEYRVTLAAYQELPRPTGKDWELRPVDVKMPELPTGATCWIDDREVTGHVSRLPGAWIEVVYRRTGYEHIKKTHEVTFDPEQTLQAPALSEWRTIEVSVAIPELPNGVTLWIDGRQQTKKIVAKPGVRLRCEYKKEGFKDIVRQYPVSSDLNQILPGPGDVWEELPVSVVVPKLEVGIEIWIDNQSVKSGTQLSLQPGQHTCKYLRHDYEPQELPFSVSHGNAEWPLPKKWKEVGSLRFISEAEEALEKGEPEEAQDLLKKVSADILSPANVKRLKAISKQAECVEAARFRFDNSEWSGVLQNYAAAVDSGYKLSEDDWENVKKAYPQATEDPEYRIRQWEEYIKNRPWKPKPFGENSEQIYDRAKKDLDMMGKWYEKCSRARR